jgi:hypothetical protein
MVANIESRKVKLIAFIAALQHEEALNALENMIQQFQFTHKSKGLTTLSKAELTHFKRPIREDVTVEDLAKEQNWQPIDEQKMDAIARKLDIKEPIELLMAQLTA